MVAQIYVLAQENINRSGYRNVQMEADLKVWSLSSCRLRVVSHCLPDPQNLRPRSGAHCPGAQNSMRRRSQHGIRVGERRGHGEGILQSLLLLRKFPCGEQVSIIKLHLLRQPSHFSVVYSLIELTSDTFILSPGPHIEHPCAVDSGHLVSYNRTIPQGGFIIMAYLLASYS